MYNQMRTFYKLQRFLFCLVLVFFVFFCFFVCFYFLLLLFFVCLFVFCCCCFFVHIYIYIKSVYIHVHHPTCRFTLVTHVHTSSISFPHSRPVCNISELSASFYSLKFLQGLISQQMMGSLMDDGSDDCK